MRPQNIDIIRKKLHDTFHAFGLEITVQTNLVKVDFLDVSFDLCLNTFEPYRKPNDTPIYIHRDSNHPYHVIKNVPLAVNKRLSNISSSESLFNKHKIEYQQALNKSRFSHILKYNLNDASTTNSASTQRRTQTQTSSPTPLRLDPWKTLS